MKHAVIPTDFSLNTLQSVHDVMHTYADGPVAITLLHLVEMPDGIGDLLFRHRRQGRHPEPEPFRQAREILLNRYAGRLEKLNVAVRPCTSVAYLEHFLEAWGAAAVFIRPQQELGLTYTDSIPMLPLIQRCRVCPIVECTDAHYAPKPSLAGVGDLLLAR